MGQSKPSPMAHHTKAAILSTVHISRVARSNPLSSSLVLSDCFWRWSRVPKNTPMRQPHTTQTQPTLPYSNSMKSNSVAATVASRGATAACHKGADASAWSALSAASSKVSWVDRKLSAAADKIMPAEPRTTPSLARWAAATTQRTGRPNASAKKRI